MHAARSCRGRFGGRRMARLVRLAIVVSVVVMFGVLAGTASAEDQVIHGEMDLTDITFPDAYLTGACGFDVQETINLHLTATVRLNAAGLPRNEVDTVVGTLRYSALASGKSTTRPANLTTTADYGAGAVEGSSAVVTAVGSGAADAFTGQPGSGTFVAVEQVVGFDPLGIPFTSYVSTVSATGEFDRATRTVCKQLSS